MAHGTADWANRRSLTVVHTGIGDDELAVRLGAVSIYNRAGKTLFWDNFEHGLARWHYEEHPPNSTVLVVTAPIGMGAQSIHFHVANTVNGVCGLSNRVPIVDTGKVGFEVGFRYEDNCQDLEFRCYVYNGDEYFEYRIYFDLVNMDAYYRRVGGIWVKFIDNLQRYLYAGYFNLIKLIVNMTTDFYDTLLINGTNHNMQSFKPVKAASSLAKQVQLVIYYDGQTLGTGDVYVGSVAFTIEET